MASDPQKPKRIGNWKPGPGRPKGSKNIATLQRELALKAAAERIQFTGDASADALALLKAVYQSPDVPLPVRLAAARDAAAYERPRKSVSLTGQFNQEAAGRSVAVRLDEALKRTGRMPAMIDGEVVPTCSAISADDAREMDHLLS